MSPDSFERPIFNRGYAYERGVHSNGYAYSNSNVNDANGARPVLNLSSKILKNGNGTASDPYRLASWSKIKNICAIK